MVVWWCFRFLLLFLLW